MACAKHLVHLIRGQLTLEVLDLPVGIYKICCSRGPARLFRSMSHFLPEPLRTSNVYQTHVKGDLQSFLHCVRRRIYPASYTHTSCGFHLPSRHIRCWRCVGRCRGWLSGRTSPSAVHPRWCCTFLSYEIDPKVLRNLQRPCVLEQTSQLMLFLASTPHQQHSR